MNAYKNRVIDHRLQQLLSVAPAVHLVGPRACGKTTTARQHIGSELALDPTDAALLSAIELQPRSALEGDSPRLIDEWQLIPQIWSAIRRSVDEQPGAGQFILSGSAWPNDSASFHSGAGRIIDLRMRPMSLYESGESDGTVSLAQLFNHEVAVGGVAAFDIRKIVNALIRGGWPGWISVEADLAQIMVNGYLDAIVQRDFPHLAGVRRSPARLRAFLQAYASLTAHPVPLSTVRSRLEMDGLEVGRDFPAVFHDFAERMYLIEDQEAWSPQRRSKTRLVANPKRHLVDPSLAASLLNLSFDGLQRDGETFGFLFESMVVRDLRVYAQSLGGRLFHYRTKDATAEIDAIIELPDGRWAGIEVKLNPDSAVSAAQRLTEIASSITRPPEFLAVVTPSGAAMSLADNLFVIPLDRLRP